ncbi:MAG: hypothetical protein Kow00108_11640 [Calditrichia bacterium]
MKRLLLGIILTITVILMGCTSSEKTFPNQDNSGTALNKGTVVELSFTTAYVADATGTIPSTRHMNVYLPYNYDQQAEATYPVVYLLHGYGGDYNTWVSRYKINDVLDLMIANGEIDPSIVVMPDGSNPVMFQGMSNGGGFYANSVLDPTYQTPIAQNAAFGLFEFYMVGDPTQALGVDPNSVIGWFENFSDYADYVDKTKRTIAGHSMGGYGAMMLTVKYPSLFNATASMSAPLAFENFFEDDAEYQVDILDRFKYVELPQVVDSLQVAPGVFIKYFNPEKLSIYTPLSAIMYTLSTMFSPVVKDSTTYDLSYEVPLQAVGGPLKIGAQLPVDITGEVKTEVKTRWLTYYDVYTLVDANSSVLNDEHLFIDCGINDVTDPMVSMDGAGFGIIYHVRDFHQLLMDKGIAHEYEEYSGNHSNEIYYRVQKALKYLDQNKVRPLM